MLVGLLFDLVSQLGHILAQAGHGIAACGEHGERQYQPHIRFIHDIPLIKPDVRFYEGDIMNKSYVWLVLAFAVLAAGCNTMSGLGKDVSKLGDKIEQKADEHK